MSYSVKTIKYLLIFASITISFSSSFAQTNNQDKIGKNLNNQQIQKQNKKWQRQRINSTIIDKSGQAFEGQLLYINDTVVYQYLSHEDYQPDLLLNSTAKFNINEIDQINIFRKGQTLRGLKQGLIFGSLGTLFLTFITEESAWGRMWNLLGATIWVMPVSTLTGVIIGSGRKIDVEYKTHNGNTSASDILPLLNKYALFKENPPLGLPIETEPNNNDSLLDINKVITTIEVFERSENKAIVNSFKSPSYISRFHLEMGVGISANYRNQVLRTEMNKLGYFEGAIKDPFINDLKLEFGFSYQLTDHIRLGFTFHPKSYWTEGLYKQLLDNRYFVLSDTYTYGSSTIIGADYVIHPVKRILNKRFEMLFGLGIAYNSLTVDQSVSIAEFEEFSVAIYESIDAEFHKNLWGAKTHFQLDYYLTRNFSLYLKTAAFYFPKLDIPKITVNSQYLNRSGTLNAHHTNISTIDVSLGLHVHF